MASTPSASALSAVLRCKRPPGSAYRLGLTYGAAPQPISRADKLTDKPEKRGSLWGLILPDARGVDPPEAKSGPPRLEFAKARGQNKQKCRIQHVPESCFSPKTSEEMSQQLQTQSHRRILGVNVDRLDSNSRLDKHSSCLRIGGSLAVKITPFSGHGAVFTVYLDYKRNPNVSLMNQAISYHSFSVLKSRLRQITALVSEVVLARLGAVWKKVPVSNNHLTECGKKNKPKKGLEPGT